MIIEELPHWLLSVVPLFLGFALDQWLGDPAWLPHPVRAIGKASTQLESLLRSKGLTGFWGGVLHWILIVGTTTTVAYVLHSLSHTIHPIVGVLVDSWMVFQGVALKDLEREVKQIHQRLHNGDLPAARQWTSRIVSRSTDGMDESAVARSAIESAAENTVDGVISPLLWAFLFGPVGLWAFKAISTLDSLVGYRTPKYEKFGKCAARLDDGANLIGARLSIPLFAIVCRHPLRCLYIGLRDRFLHVSPNSGHPEAAMAGALGIRLGGPAVYHGETKAKPWFGAEFPDALTQHITRAMAICRRASILFLFTLALVAAVWIK